MKHKELVHETINVKLYVIFSNTIQILSYLLQHKIHLEEKWQKNISFSQNTTEILDSQLSETQENTEENL